MADVREAVNLQRALWSEYAPVATSIDDGEVTLTGEVGRRALAESLLRTVRAVRASWPSARR